MSTQKLKSVGKEAGDCEFCELIQQELQKESNATRERPRLTSTGKILLGVTGAAATAMFAVTVPFVLPALRKVCLPYVPATDRQVENVLRLLRGRSGSLIDLGSGDGRIVLAAAREGFRAEGVELNHWLVWWSRLSAWRQGLSRSTSFYTKDLWKMDISKYDNVVVFGVEQMMPDLERKLISELSADGRVVACRFRLPHSTPEVVLGEGIDTVWLYSRDNLTTSQLKR